jgi:hypothetical protein
MIRQITSMKFSNVNSSVSSCGIEISCLGWRRIWILPRHNILTLSAWPNLFALLHDKSKNFLNCECLTILKYSHWLHRICWAQRSRIQGPPSLNIPLFDCDVCFGNYIIADKMAAMTHSCQMSNLLWVIFALNTLFS